MGSGGRMIRGGSDGPELRIYTPAEAAQRDQQRVALELEQQKQREHAAAELQSTLQSLKAAGPSPPLDLTTQGVEPNPGPGALHCSFCPNPDEFKSEEGLDQHRASAHGAQLGCAAPPAPPMALALVPPAPPAAAASSSNLTRKLFAQRYTGSMRIVGLMASVVETRERLKFLEHTLASIAAQEIPQDVEFDMHVGVHITPEAVKQLKLSFPNIHFTSLKEPAKQFAIHKQLFGGIDAGRPDVQTVFLFSDDDDLWNTTRVRQAVEAFRSQPDCEAWWPQVTNHFPTVRSTVVANAANTVLIPNRRPPATPVTPDCEYRN